MNALLVAILAAASMFFAVNWFFTAQASRSMTEVQRRQAKIDEENRRLNKKPLKRKLQDKLRDLGWQGDIAPIMLLMTFVYLTCAFVLSLFGFDGIFGVVLALPLSVGVAFSITSNIASKRRRLFHVQLIQALDLLASQLKAGAAPNRAIEMVLPSLPEPIRGELTGALNQSRATRPLADAVAEVGERYPSRAMSMFVAALRIDEEQPGKITQSLEQAAATVRKDFELNAEAMAEIAQDKAQFFGIVGVVAMIVVYMFTRGDDQTREALFSPVGITIIVIFGGNFVFGIWRTLRLFARARGEY